MEKKFYKTVITVTVLSECGPVSPNANLDLIARQIDSGDWSGQVETDGGVEITPAEAAKELAAQGSDPGFFMLDVAGNPISTQR